MKTMPSCYIMMLLTWGILMDTAYRYVSTFSGLDTAGKELSHPCDDPCTQLRWVWKVLNHFASMYILAWMPYDGVNNIFAVQDCLGCTPWLTALETTVTKYPNESGSWVTLLAYAWPSAYHRCWGIYLFSFHAPVGHIRSAFYGEVEAIRLALRQIKYLCLKLTHIVILIDSKYAIQARGKLELPKTTSQVSEVIPTFKQQDVLLWIQGHCYYRKRESWCPNKQGNFNHTNHRQGNSVKTTIQRIFKMMDAQRLAMENSTELHTHLTDRCKQLSTFWTRLPCESSKLHRILLFIYILSVCLHYKLTVFYTLPL